MQLALILKFVVYILR